MDGARGARKGVRRALPRPDRGARRAGRARAARRVRRPRAGRVASRRLRQLAREHGRRRRRGERPRDVRARDRSGDGERARVRRSRVDRARRRRRGRALLASPELAGFAHKLQHAARGEAVRPERARGAGAERAQARRVVVGVAARPPGRDARGPVRRGQRRRAALRQRSPLVPVPARPRSAPRGARGALRRSRAARRGARRVLRRARRRPARNGPCARLRRSDAADEHGERARRGDGRVDVRGGGGELRDRPPLVRGEGRAARSRAARALRPVRTGRRGTRVSVGGGGRDRRRVVRPLLAELCRRSSAPASTRATSTRRRARGRRAARTARRCRSRRCRSC